ncbi:MAG: DUF1926 domain-containing protein [Candidatus Saganbacteria bacterium]|nr:DUF1926 domain-containing protein [Candidatus Saganbacteria bacterium]
MKKLKFLFGVHCHQPVGNFDHVFEDAYSRAYLPFFETLARHPKIKFAAHLSGVLFDWLGKNHPEFLDLLNKLIKRGQLELLSGGYYEPILSIIPDADKLGQIELQNQFIRQKFLRAPQGLWLTERVWEPSLPKILSQAGIEYVLLDDDHFIRTGMNPDKLFGYYITEEKGETIKVFPISRRLRELIPFRSPGEILEYLKSIPNPDGNAAVCFVDDGEKFGMRPETHKWIYEEGYLEKLLSLLSANSDWIEFTSFSNYLEEYLPCGRIYLASGSYNEMQKWSSLSPEPEFNGYFRNFFVKYPAANRMHKRMLLLSHKLNSLFSGKSLIGKDKKTELDLARKHLFAGQCNCAFWHGMFGGLFLNHLRHAIYSNLIQAENLLSSLSRGGKPFVELTLGDFDKDGEDEVILSNDLLNLYFSPRQGGALFELDYKPKAFNLLNTMEQVYSRFSLLDHFLLPDTSFSQFVSAENCEAADFIGGRYSFMPKRKPGEVGLRLEREGNVSGAPVKVSKSISLYPKQSIFSVEYEVTNLGREPDEFWFGVEFNFSMLAGNAPDRYYVIGKKKLKDKSLGSSGETENVSLLKLVDEYSGFDVSLELGKPATLWRFGVVTTSRSEKGFDNIYQSSCLLFNWKFKLGPNETWKVKVLVRIEE